MFPVIRTLGVHGSCLPLKNSKLNLFRRHTLQAYKSFCCKAKGNAANADELVTEPLYYNDNIQVGNDKYYIEEGLKRASVASLIFYMNMEIVCALMSLIRNTV